FVAERAGPPYGARLAQGVDRDRDRGARHLGPRLTHEPLGPRRVLRLDERCLLTLGRPAGTRPEVDERASPAARGGTRGRRARVRLGVWARVRRCVGVGREAQRTVLDRKLIDTQLSVLTRLG